MNTKEPENTPASKEIGKATLRRRKHVAGNRANAQRDKLDAQTEARAQQAAEKVAAPSKGKQDQKRMPANRCAGTTIAHAIEEYLQDHAGGNHSDKTLEWHRTSLGLMQSYLEQQCGITQVAEVDAPAISGWFADMRTSPGSRGAGDRLEYW